MKKALFITMAIMLCSCNISEEEWYLTYIPNEIDLKENLSSYSIFKNEMKMLQPNDGVYLYDISTPLFTDYANKQRLVKLPPGTEINYVNSGLLNFPEGTILVKTFYYGNTAQNRKIMETRLLIKSSNSWNVGVYEWNDQQNEAFLITEGKIKNITVYDSNNSKRNISYEIPSNLDCTSCHNASDNTMPIGPKARNLKQPLLKDWHSIGLLDSKPDPYLQYVPDWEDQSKPIEERGRAYLDVNCAHCHNEKGIASAWGLDLEYNTPFENTGVSQKKYEILERMKSNWQDEKMPKIGTTLKHSEGITLIETYLNGL